MLFGFLGSISTTYQLDCATGAVALGPKKKRQPSAIAPAGAVILRGCYAVTGSISERPARMI